MNAATQRRAAASIALLAGFLFPAGCHRADTTSTCSASGAVLTVGFSDSSIAGADAIVAPLGEDMTAEILPRVELLSGVLSQTSWFQQHGPSGSGNRYLVALQALMQPYRGHAAVQTAQKLTSDGFTYDAPPAFVLLLGPLPDLAAPGSYGSYLNNRARGTSLDEFRSQLRDLAEAAGFLEFFASQTPALESAMQASLSGFRGREISTWLRSFSGDASLVHFHCVFAPAMFPGGGYGSHRQTTRGVEVFEVVRENGQSQTVPVFPRGDDLSSLAIHEFGHSFVNPAVEKHLGLACSYGLDELFTPVKSKMEALSYGDFGTFMEEQVLRAAVILGRETALGARDRAAQIASEESRGFYLTSFTVDALDDYARNRATYPTFDSYIPRLFEAFRDNKQALLRRAR